VLALESGVQLFRTHDVAATAQALRAAEAVLARKK
jgi:dihydropteroate synthase